MSNEFASLYSCWPAAKSAIFQRLIHKYAEDQGVSLSSILRSLASRSEKSQKELIDVLFFEKGPKDPSVLDGVQDLLKIPDSQLKTALVADEEIAFYSVNKSWPDSFKPGAWQIFERTNSRFDKKIGIKSNDLRTDVDLTDVKPENYLSHTLKIFKERKLHPQIQRLYTTPIAFGIRYTPNYAEYYSWQGEYIGAKDSGDKYAAVPCQYFPDFCSNIDRLYK